MSSLRYFNINKMHFLICKEKNVPFFLSGFEVSASWFSKCSTWRASHLLSCRTEQLYSVPPFTISDSFKSKGLQSTLKFSVVFNLKRRGATLIIPMTFYLVLWAVRWMATHCKTKYKHLLNKVCGTGWYLSRRDEVTSVFIAYYIFVGSIHSFSCRRKPLDRRRTV